jgi:hypothetical protein
MCQDGLSEMARDEWMAIHFGISPTERWQHKFRHLRIVLQGWAKNHSDVYKKQNTKLTIILIDKLD